MSRLPGPFASPSRKAPPPEVAAEPGLVVEDVETGWVGAVLRTEKSGGVHLVVLEDRRGKVRAFPLGPGFWIDGAPVRLVAPTVGRPRAADPDGVRFGRRPRRAGPDGAREPDPRRGPARR